MLDLLSIRHSRNMLDALHVCGRELAERARTPRTVVVAGTVAGALHSWPIMLGSGTLDLVRDAQSMQITPDLAVRVSSLTDLIRIAEASPDPDARMFISALWATLERSRRYAAETPEAEHARA